jgi:hypothetical protein
VEALRNGVYRSDFPVKFKFEKQAYEDLIENIDKVFIHVSLKCFRL